MAAFALLSQIGLQFVLAFGILGLITAYIAGQLFLRLLRQALDLFSR